MMRQAGCASLPAYSTAVKLPVLGNQFDRFVIRFTPPVKKYLFDIMESGIVLIKCSFDHYFGCEEQRIWFLFENIWKNRLIQNQHISHQVMYL
jgi:hypothetical protein